MRGGGAAGRRGGAAGRRGGAAGRRIVAGVPLTTDRFLRYDELTSELQALAAAHPDLVTIDSVGRSHESRELWLVTITDTTTGPHDEKPAMWIDANIHATEVTASVAALAVVDRLVSGFGVDDTVTRALQTRTFYVLPRVNPDGVELALAERPRYLRSSARPWPWTDGHRPSGLYGEDVDGDGRILMMRVPDPHGAWKRHPDEPRLMTPRAITDGPDDGPYWRLFEEGSIVDHDGFTVPSPPPPEALDLNRNFPAGWSTSTPGAGDFPGSEPEIDALIRAVRARPNICGYNAFHTAGGVLLRPSSTAADSTLPAVDVWTWQQIGTRCTELTTYPVHSVYEDFTWDKTNLMAGAADDWAYEHLGVYSWTTEFWDAIHAATGTRGPTDIWFFGPTSEQELAVLRWLEANGHPGFVEWYDFDHPQLGAVELGGWDFLRTWVNPPEALLADEVRPHADFAVFQALAAPCLSVEHARAVPLGAGLWRVEAGVSNTGWLPTYVSERGKKESLTLPVAVALEASERVETVGGPARVELGQLEGRSRFRRDGGSRMDGTPDRALATWVVRGHAGDEVAITARHQRAGTARATISL